MLYYISPLASISRKIISYHFADVRLVRRDISWEKEDEDECRNVLFLYNEHCYELLLHLPRLSATVGLHFEIWEETPRSRGVGDREFGDCQARRKKSWCIIHATARARGRNGVRRFRETKCTCLEAFTLLYYFWIACRVVGKVVIAGLLNIKLRRLACSNIDWTIMSQPA